MTFEGGKTGDAVKDAVLADSAEMTRAVDAAIAGTDPKGEAMGYYTTGKALEASVSWVAQFKKADVTITGVVRYYDRKVTLESKTAAVLTPMASGRHHRSFPPGGRLSASRSEGSRCRRGGCVGSCRMRGWRAEPRRQAGASDGGHVQVLGLGE
ncbi:hypothetical protein ACWCY6_11375 [Streptomyces sp. 900105755]